MTDIEIPEGFTRWDGGDCPVSPDTQVAYILRNGDSEAHGVRAHCLSWSHPAFDGGSDDYDGADIIAYRIVSDA